MVAFRFVRQSRERNRQLGLPTVFQLRSLDFDVPPIFIVCLGRGTEPVIKLRRGAGSKLEVGGFVSEGLDEQLKFVRLRAPTERPLVTGIMLCEQFHIRLVADVSDVELVRVPAGHHFSL